MALTPKQEKFAQKYIETGNASEAYRQSYNTGKTKPDVINVKASELLAHGKVSVRVKELQLAAQNRHGVTVDSLTAEYEEARQIARENSQTGPMVSATTGKAKLHGLVVEKQEAKHDVSVTFTTIYE